MLSRASPPCQRPPTIKGETCAENYSHTVTSSPTQEIQEVSSKRRSVKMNKIATTATYLAFACLFLTFSRDAEAVPVMGECLPGGEVTELCQRCAKFTKATNVFGLCCNEESEPSTNDNSNKKSVRSWCLKFLKFDLPYYNIGGAKKEPTTPLEFQ